jgi:hypothetical protein
MTASRSLLCRTAGLTLVIGLAVRAFLGSRVATAARSTEPDSPRHVNVVAVESQKLGETLSSEVN